MAVDQEDLEQFRALIDQPDAGLVKPDGRPDALERVGVRGGELTSTSSAATSSTDMAPTSLCNNGQLQTGFAGANYGFFLRLGRNVALDDLIQASEENRLQSSRLRFTRLGVNCGSTDLLRNIKEIRTHQRDAKGKIVQAFPFREGSGRAKRLRSFLRSIQIDRHDILVGARGSQNPFRQELSARLQDLQHYDTPVAVGRGSSDRRSAIRLSWHPYPTPKEVAMIVHCGLPQDFMKF